MKFFATTSKGLELLLVEELRQLGATDAAEKLAGVTFSGDLALAYKACLWSRLANRILLHLTDIPAATPEELYAGVQTIPWYEHLAASGSLLVNFVCSHSNITHTLFGAQKVKDAIVDQFREKFAERPNVAKDQPDLAVNIYLHRNIASISLDLAGESLHKRGYRLEHGAAPLKETLAAALLLRAKWPAIAKEGGALLDPMCGSGTLLIEAALLAGNIAPGLSRDYFGFKNWKKHDAALWQKLLTEAKSKADITKIPSIVGYDHDPHAIKIAFANIERAGLRGKIHVEKRELSAFTPKSNEQNGLCIVNPPYGERLGEETELKKLYEQLGEQLKQYFVNWQAAVFTGNPELAKSMGLRAYKHYALFNGALACQLLLFNVQADKFVDRSPAANNERRIRHAARTLTEEQRLLAQDFVNRLKKKLKHVSRWAKRENVTYYRLYDADLPEYAVSIDLYDQYVLVQEYQAPRSIDQQKALQRLNSILVVLPEILGVPAANIYFQKYLEDSFLPDGFPEITTTLKFPPR
jgi:23S rRNA (guanine2445-N2)-methyltransferase / 23S rRNA (guanine2069-N7)-methyltransferase